MHKILKVLTSRLMIVTPLIILQFLFFVGVFYSLAIGYELASALSFLSIIATIYIMNRDEDPAYKIAWIIAILGAPIIGVPLYLLAGNRHVPKKLYNGTILVNQEMNSLLTDSHDLMKEEHALDPSIRNLFQYANRTCYFPVYQNTSSKYYASGEEWFPEYLEALRSAKKFIFIEFFIIDQGHCLDQVIEILQQKVKEGVEVKIIYDDFGSITLPRHYSRQLRQMGIEAHRFNHVRPAFIIQMNNRDHRKITIIDNQIAFTGGVNLADEYMNEIQRFGYWKDSAIKIEGEAVWSFTVMFMGMFSFCRNAEEGKMNYQKYKLPAKLRGDGGFYQPYSDTPTDSESLALNMHLNLVNNAQKYIYIDTPYLILTETMKQALIRAAKKGVDVRILTPHIPDKKLVFQITKGFYKPLVEAGVQIYEYLQGFNHCKNFVSDDCLGIVGSTNTDYRSYFLHFENGVLMYQTPEILKMKADFLSAMEKSKKIELSEINKTNLVVRLVRAILNIFIPLL